MFSVIAIIAGLVVLAGCVLDFILRRPSFDDLFGAERPMRVLDCVRFFVLGITLLLPIQKASFLLKIRRLVLALSVICFLVLVVTGFFPVLILGESIFGYWMMIHVIFGGVFAFCLALLAVLWAQDNRLDVNCCPLLRKLFLEDSQNAASGGRVELLQRAVFWLLMFLAMPLVLSILLSMFTLFGTDIQEFLLACHRYIALGFALIAVVFAYLAMINNAKKV